MTFHEPGKNKSTGILSLLIRRVASINSRSRAVFARSDNVPRVYYPSYPRRSFNARCLFHYRRETVDVSRATEANDSDLKLALVRARSVCIQLIYTLQARASAHGRSASERNESWRISGSLKYLITPCGAA